MRTNLTKVLGISLLAIVGILAVNVSAAHATWTLLRNGSIAVGNLLDLNAELLESELLVPGLLSKNCTGGEATGHILGGTILQGDIHASITGCKILKFASCEVKSPSTAVGTILVGTSVEVLMTVSEQIIIENELCPLNEKCSRSFSAPQ